MYYVCVCVFGASRFSTLSLLLLCQCHPYFIHDTCDVHYYAIYAYDYFDIVFALLDDACVVLYNYFQCALSI